MKRTISAVLVVALSMGLVTSASASPRKLSSELLSISQMPIGWSIVSSAGSGGSGGLSGCFNFKGQLKATADANVTFAGGGNLPEVAEDLASYATTPIAMVRKRFSTVVSALNRCQSVTMNGAKTTVHIGQMSFPKFGNQSAAYSFTFKVSGLNAEVDVLLTRVGKVVAAVMEVDLGTVDVVQFRGFVVKALAKI